MKRSLLAAVSAALLLAGCATGETGHLDPEIEPDLMEVRSSPVADAGSGSDGGSEAVETPAPGTSAAPANDVEAAFSASSGSETWFTDVSAVDIDGDAVLVTTRLQPGDPGAADVCEAAYAAAASTGIGAPTIEVRALDGSTISERLAGDEACSRVES